MGLFFVISATVIILRLHLANYLPVLFVLLFFPFLIYLGVNLAFTSSAYIKKHHIDFYEQYKSMTLGTDGNIVNLLLVSDKKITELQDQKVLIFKKEMIGIIKLIIVCFLSFILLSILTTIMAQRSSIL
ncbi:MAG TPA: hypothetical protein DIT10_19655 [Chryseobacterium sp.]|nr:hypothetical protein [Chryseobacterium sp.]